MFAHFTLAAFCLREKAIALMQCSSYFSMAMQWKKCLFSYEIEEKIIRASLIA